MAPTIESNSPTDPVQSTDVEVEFVTKDTGPGVDLSTIDCTIDGQNAVVGGVIQTGFDGPNSAITINAFSGYDVAIDPTGTFLGEVPVTVYCEDTLGNPATLEWSFIAYNFDNASTKGFTGIGIRPFITNVENPDYGILRVTFSEEMENDRSLTAISSYTVAPIGSSSVVHVTNVLRLNGTQVQLSFTGGGSAYFASATGLIDIAGNYIIPDQYAFDISLPGIDELLTGDKIFVETDLGAVALTVSSLSQRRIEDLAIQRARNLGHSAQLSLISGALRDSGINRDEQKLKLFKG